MDKIITEFINALTRFFSQPWRIAAILSGGILLVFFFTLIFGLFTGDFVRCKRACRVIIKGDVKKGLFKLKAQRPRMEEGAKTPPPASQFDYTKIVASPYSYSMIKHLPLVTLAVTAFFALLSIPLCSLIADEAKRTQYTVFSVLACAVIGLVFFIVALIVSAASRKGASKRYFLMLEMMQKAEPKPAPRITNDYSHTKRDQDGTLEISDSAKELCDRIKKLAREGGADVKLLKELVARFEYERQSPKNAGYDAQQKLAATGEILNMLLDSLAE